MMSVEWLRLLSMRLSQHYAISRETLRKYHWHYDESFSFDLSIIDEIFSKHYRRTFSWCRLSAVRWCRRPYRLMTLLFMNISITWTFLLHYFFDFLHWWFSAMKYFLQRWCRAIFHITLIDTLIVIFVASFSRHRCRCHFSTGSRRLFSFIDYRRPPIFFWFLLLGRWFFFTISCDVSMCGAFSLDDAAMMPIDVNIFKDFISMSALFSAKDVTPMCRCRFSHLM